MPLDARGDSAVGVCAPATSSSAPSAPSDGGVVDLRGSCPSPNHECRLYGTNPMFGTVSFDSIGAAWMTIFQYAPTTAHDGH